MKYKRPKIILNIKLFQRYTKLKKVVCRFHTNSDYHQFDLFLTQLTKRTCSILQKNRI